MKKGLFAGFAVLLIASLFSMQTGKSLAVTGADWQAGRITDDVIFTNKDSASVADIQNFLNQQVGTTSTYGTPGVCDTNGVKTSELSGGTRAQYGAAHGNPTPYTCLKDYYEVPKTTPGPGIPANNYGGQPIPAGAISAAQMIWNAAQQYNISPKVLLVMIQKESAGPLITDDWPFQSQYTYAMGAHCPDTTGCDPNYAGFSIQISESAALLRYYLDNMTQSWWPYKKLGNNAILYNPNSACGSSNVNITTSATAALYTYTPYQPNQAALNNLYGTGDSCSAYGNRNFWRIYSDWFGSTYAPNYSWQVMSQYAYTDSTKTVGKGTTGLLPGDTVYVGFQAKNTGNTTWTNTGPNPVKVGTTGPLDRMSAFCDGWAYGCNRPAIMQESSVPPGSMGTFEFLMKAPSTPGVYNEHFDLIAEGAAWMPDNGLTFFMTVVPQVYSWQFMGQYAYTDPTKTTGKSTTSLLPGDRVYVGFQAKNTGNVTWHNNGSNPVNVGMTRPLDRASPFYDSTWLGTNRPAHMVEASVPPGGIGTFEFWVKAPSTPGTYTEYYSLVAEGTAWMNDPGLNFYITVQQPIYTWQLVSQYAYTDPTKTTGKPTIGLRAGDRVYVGFQARNTGNVTWHNNGLNPVNVGLTHPLDRLSIFYDGSWLGQNRPATLKEPSVPPGGIGTFEYWVDVPNNAQPGTYREYFDLLSEGMAWFQDPALNFYITIT